MNQLFSILTTSAYDWSLDFETRKDITAVANDVGFRCTSSTKDREVSDFIKKEIKSLLTSDECTYKDYITIFKQLSLDFYCNEKHADEFNLLSYLRFILNFLEGYTIDERKWIEVHKLLQNHIYITNHSNAHLHLGEKDRVISDAVKRFRNKGIAIDISEGEVTLKDEQFKKILQGIDFRAKKLGDKLYTYVLSEIKSCYNIKHDRFYLRKQLSPVKRIEPVIPIGYLYNLSIRNLNSVKNYKYKIQLAEILELSKDLMTILDLQILNPYESLLSGSDIIPYMRKNILYDQLFTLHQYSNKNARKLVNGLFNRDYNSKIPNTISLKIYIDIFELAHKKQNIEIQVMKIEYLFENLLGKYTKKEIEEAINELCIDEKEVNKNYINPFDINYVNYYKKPFIKKSEEIIYLNSYFHSDGFLCFLKNRLKIECNRIGIFGKEFGFLRGEIAEEFVRNLFHSKGVSYRAGLKYDVKGNSLKDIGLKSKEGECDFIIETNESIIFIEEKSKELGVSSKSGDVLSGLWDLLLTLLNSQEQICRHEYLLRKHGKINFNNGEALELKGRKIEKVSLTLFDFHSLADVNSVRSFLISSLNSNITSTSKDKNVKKKINEINKTHEKLQMLYSSNIFKNEYINPDNSLNTLNSRFFSSNQLITMLEHCTGNDGFLDIMNKTKAIANNSQDWFSTFNHFVIDIYKNKNRNNLTD
ncbi:hypothetical protein [Vibrio diabolicus]|uniref:hypothetical protein n=1 Tax=Vibrio diabolicus TaxID=50719 RepID=UPI002495663F|nr:hypothetical protein [Vibrio diabolicus]